jgi:glycosyltransferase involved in cell wall biosynthesis
MNILQVSASDGGGGAHKVAYALYDGFRARGHRSAMAVARPVSGDPEVYTIPLSISAPRRFVQRGLARASRPLARRIDALRLLPKALGQARPLGWWRAREAGREFFDYPGSRRILELPPFDPDIVHLHNLHKDYFDLRSLRALSRATPVALTLHDEWTFTGHCGYGITCERWRLGCGSCPDLTTYPAILRDATHENWLAKQEIYRGSRLYVTAPSQWLLDRARQSILAEAAADFRLIPNGVNQSVFEPAPREAARDLLGLPRDRLTLVYAANAVDRNAYKDYGSVAAAVEHIAAVITDRPLLLVSLGGEGASRSVGSAELRFVPYERDAARVAAYYQAADVYLHAANADTFPTTILEALSVGRPVVATAVGGIHEEVRSLAGAPGAWTGAGVGRFSATGVLVAPKDAEGMAAATVALLTDDELRMQLGANAAADAKARFGLDRQLDETLAWYGESIEAWRRWSTSAT